MSPLIPPVHRPTPINQPPHPSVGGNDQVKPDRGQQRRQDEPPQDQAGKRPTPGHHTDTNDGEFPTIPQPTAPERNRINVWAGQNNHSSATCWQMI